MLVDTSAATVSGTGWAVQMAIDRGIKEIYVFDLITKFWGVPEHGMFWGSEILPPKPYGIYTGIGSRELTDAGYKAITELYNS